MATWTLSSSIANMIDYEILANLWYNEVKKEPKTKEELNKYYNDHSNTRKSKITT